MPEHRIRLRGPWDREDAETLRRVTLPANWPPDQPPSFRLIRKFGRPPFDPSAESARLELLGVPGLVAVRVNDRELARISIGAAEWSVPLVEPLLGRNVLVLDVDLSLNDGPETAEGWGVIALVISEPDGPGEPIPVH